MADQTDMIRKIQFCLNLANDPGATEAEKAHAQATAEKLMVRYAIDEAMLHVQSVDAGGDKAKDVVDTAIFLKGDGDNFIPEQRRVLATVLGGAMNCRCVITHKNETVDVDSGRKIPGGDWLIVVGFRKDVSAVDNLYKLLVPDLALAVAKEPSSKANYVREFAQGYVEEIGRRLFAMKRNVEAEVRKTSATTALVLVSKSEIVAQEFDNRFPNLSAYRSGERRQYDGNARARGAKAAASADLGQGKVGSGARKGIGS